MKVVVISGGFDPIHRGHIAYIQAARELGDVLLVGVNSDEWLTRKKGKPFMNITDRLAIVQNIKGVTSAYAFNDTDNTARDAIYKAQWMYPDASIIFANGGDRQEGNTPEQDISNVVFAFGVGGDDKIQSSSWILERHESIK